MTSEKKKKKDTSLLRSQTKDAVSVCVSRICWVGQGNLGQRRPFMFLAVMAFLPPGYGHSNRHLTHSDSGVGKSSRGQVSGRLMTSPGIM